MKHIKDTRRYLRIIMLPLFAFMLVLSTVLPSMALAADGGTIAVTLETKVGSSKVITEEKINSSTDTIEIVLKLTGNTWVAGINNDAQLKSILLQGMTTNYKPGMLSLLLDSVDTITGGGTDTLTITVPNKEGYLIEDNQVVTMDISPVLIENWYGSVEQLNFTIYAKPNISVGGSILNVTPTDIQNGGKAIELNLINAKWDETVVRKISGWNSILDALEGHVGTVSNIATELKKENPNNVVYLENEGRTLRIVLPAFPSGLAGETVTLRYSKLVDINSNLNNGIIFDEVDNEKIGNALTEVGGQMTFEIMAIQGVTSLKLETFDVPVPPATPTASAMTEAAIVAGKRQIKLTLTNNKWYSNSFTKDDKMALIDGFSANKQTEEWNKVKEVLVGDPNSITVSDTEVTINIPSVAKYYLTEDQEITLKLPYQLLENKADLPAQLFTIEATPKILISGTATPTISQTDFVQGGKTIELKLVNASWISTIASNTALRQELLSKFTWGGVASPPDINSILNANADVIRKDDNIVEIKLPAIPGVKITQDIDVTFTPVATGWTDKTINTKQIFVTKLTQVDNQSAEVSGSILSNTNEFDIVNGGKEIIVTLKNDVWIKDTDKIREQLTTEEAPVGGTPAIYSLKVDNLGDQKLYVKRENIVRTSDTVVTIKLDQNLDFTLSDEVTGKLTIPKTLMAASSSDKSVSFKILAIKAELSGTVMPSIEPAEIQKGGKTIIITLKNATFKTGADFNAANLMNGFTGGASTDWNHVKTAVLSDPKNITVTKNKVTIKLPPVPEYKSGGETISLAIPYSLITEAPANATKTEIKADKTIGVGQVATATLSGASFSDAQIVQGNNTFKIKLTGATWDSSLPTNKSKQSALLKGFTVTDQTKEWALVIKEMGSSAKFTLNSAGNGLPAGSELTITLPAVPSYSIIRKQEVNIAIPKSVLTNYKYDVPVSQKLTITVPTLTASDKSLGELSAEELADALKNNKRVIVPGKKVETIFVNKVEFPSSSITTIEVTTTSDVKEVRLSISENTSQTVTPVGNKSIFIFTNLEKNSELRISVFGDDKSKPLQADIYKKIGSGNKTYNELPKKDYAGSYSLYNLLTDKSTLKEILKYYSIDELKVSQ